MKKKNYWDKSADGNDPFEMPKRVSRGIASTARKFAEAGGTPPSVKYIWIYTTEEGLQEGQDRQRATSPLSLDSWLNIIDESASLGAEWMIVYVGSSLTQVPGIWKMCEWGQNIHGLRVGIHLSGMALSDEDIEHLAGLDTAKTYIMAERDAIESLRFLEEKGIRLCESKLRPEERSPRCTKPEAIACVGLDGHLFTCGLVLGNERYSLGNVQERPLDAIMSDRSLPHEVSDTAPHPERGCDACPPLMARRVMESLPR